jgi:hypothetical protein
MLCLCVAQLRFADVDVEEKVLGCAPHEPMTSECPSASSIFDSMSEVTLIVQSGISRANHRDYRMLSRPIHGGCQSDSPFGPAKRGKCTRTGCHATAGNGSENIHSIARTVQLPNVHYGYTSSMFPIRLCCHQHLQPVPWPRPCRVISSSHARVSCFFYEVYPIQTPIRCSCR